MRAVWLRGENDWSVELADGEAVEDLQLMSGVFCHPLLVLFSLRSETGRQFRLVVPRDAAPVDGFRQLRVKMNNPH
ncbi:MAG: hypothetical protein DRQ60_01045 [Gammaproteobacteria bacterium]|nr:MAG: hypothetical protein DRQ54_01980 [Gammaproteobacteria bacterium]RLA14946.1 MAG: hypothetical protein DRQ52_02975 [Gammaproteobacteria bacterium]RLA17819.1 MAG: hypothetical protein DRQ60_01045 [Gammaproteobacteria bacterium]